MASMKMSHLKPDLNDVTYDAFLTNYHTLKNPQIVMVKPNAVVRLRFINGASGSNFWINLSKLTGTAIAFDGNAIKPLQSKQFQLAIGQRIDLLVKIPHNGGTFPILGQVEGLNSQTGLILTTSRGNVPKLSEVAKNIDPPLNNNQERLMHSLQPLSQKSIARVVMINLSGNMSKYIWMINGKAWPNIIPITLKQGQRIEFIFNNQSNMAHPMHLHGHDFELIGINNKKIKDGPLHDTILVLPHTQVKIIFDADYPGKWMLHCHMAYHQEAGMMTFISIKP
jgi:FtsP/CotA-like multicopper oxidase with cupredoxin domain